jgi:hypothetical protein
MKKTYIGQCEHLCNCHIEDDDCLKRYIHIINPKTNEVECLVFCNDYLKLNSQKKSYENFTSKEQIIKFIELEIFRYLKLENTNKIRGGNSISEYTFPFYILDRPFIYGYFSLQQLIEWYFDNPTQNMANLVREQICIFLDRLQYKKYKSKYKELITLSNKLKPNYLLNKEDKEIIILQLINETFKIIIKNQ